MLPIPLIFLALARICAKKTVKDQQLMKISFKGIIVLLTNVAVAFSIAFTLGVVFNIGANTISNTDINNTNEYKTEVFKSLSQLVTFYMPDSFFGVFTSTGVMQIIIIGALTGCAIKKLTKRHEEIMNKARASLETM